MASTYHLPGVNPCFVTHNLALGGAQTAVLRYIMALPEWVRERTTLYSQSDDMPLLDAAEKSGFSCGKVTREAPVDPSSWFLSYGDLSGLPQRPTSLVLHSWDDAGWRFINRAYDSLEGMTVAGVSGKVLDRYAGWAKEKNHRIVGVMTPPVSEFASVKGQYDAKGRLVVAWMGRPLESKGILALPYLLAEDPRIVIRAWTGSETAGLAYTQKLQAETLAQVKELAAKLGVADRLDLRPLDFNPFAYRHRLEGCHVLLGNSEKEGFLLTAAEALSEQPGGAWVFLGMFIALYVLTVPCTILETAGGYFFGFRHGMLLGLAGKMIGTATSMLLARTVLLGWVRRSVATRSTFRILERMVQNSGFTGIFLSRFFFSWNTGWDLGVRVEELEV
jgi:hypothetical protein